MISYLSRDVVQLVERTVRDREAGSSSLPIPTSMLLAGFDEGCKWLFELIG